ncbi:MAG: TIGR04348 family glycosyltransferase [Acidobacteria bacterium]|nr:TIGR04348 family glycosyltransferase [Acidobacteriota bacterium]
MNILLVTPAPSHSRKGNRITADRWSKLLRQLGHRVTVKQEYLGEPCDLLIALHARRSAASIRRFRQRHPDLPLIVALTGTDLYKDIKTSKAAQQSLELASRLIVLQPLGIDELPQHLRGKARVIFQSVEKFHLHTSPLKRDFQIGVFGHLRAVKDPFRAALAARLLPASSRIHVVHAGGALTKQMELRARAEEHVNSRYRWLGDLPQTKMLRLMARCRAVVLSSKMEGGANVVSEAIAMGVPVLASKISGSVGILGREYPGYFPVDSTRALLELMQRAEGDAEFLRRLQAWCVRLRPLFTPARELRSWRALIKELYDAAPPRQRHSTSAITTGRFQLVDRSIGSLDADFAGSVKAGLRSRPKFLACRFFYNAEGSKLFEAICDLPEYYLMRAEREIIQRHATEIARRLPADVTIAELGSGNAAKTRFLIAAVLQRHKRLRYVPMDISRAVLEESSRALLRACPGLEITAVAGEYQECLREFAKQNHRAKLILWLGSNIGNLTRDEAAEFLSKIRAVMNSRDALLLGIDLRKDRGALERAYDDSAGITAQFNLNLLKRINDELGGHFDPVNFRHRAVYNEDAGRVEMYLVSKRAQRVSIDRLGISVSFRRDEAIHTENSYKYSIPEIARMACNSGFQVRRQWLDAQQRFSESLLLPRTEPCPQDTRV